MVLCAEPFSFLLQFLFGSVQFLCLSATNADLRLLISKFWIVNFLCSHNFLTVCSFSLSSLLIYLCSSVITCLFNYFVIIILWHNSSRGLYLSVSFYFMRYMLMEALRYFDLFFVESLECEAIEYLFLVFFLSPQLVFGQYEKINGIK